MTKTYSQLLRDPRWQRRRLEVFDRAGFRCETCGETTKTLHSHHKTYHAGRAPWEYADDELVCLCETCHAQEHLPPKPSFSNRLDELLWTAQELGLNRSQKQELSTLLIGQARA